MQTAKKMAKFITALAEAADLDLTKADSTFELHNPPYNPLVLIVHGGQRVSIIRHMSADGNGAGKGPIETAIEVYMDMGIDAGWVPLSISHFLGGITRSAVVGPDGTVNVIDQRAHDELVEYTEEWAEVLFKRDDLQAARNVSKRNRQRTKNSAKER